MTQPREEKISQGGAKNPSGGVICPGKEGKFFFQGRRKKFPRGGEKPLRGGYFAPGRGKNFSSGGVEKAPGGVL